MSLSDSLCRLTVMLDTAIVHRAAIIVVYGWIIELKITVALHLVYQQTVPSDIQHTYKSLIAYKLISGLQITHSLATQFSKHSNPQIVKQTTVNNKS